MIRRIEALNYRCLRHVNQTLGPFHVLVGKNASGKSTFLDVVGFLGRVVSDGVETAVGERTQNFYDLVWGRKGNRFELAIEADIPEEFQTPLETPDYDLIRYEIAIGIDQETQKLAILNEQILLGNSGQLSANAIRQSGTALPVSVFKERDEHRWSHLVYRSPQNKFYLFPEQPLNLEDNGADSESYHIFLPSNPRRTIFENLSEEEFPAATWLEDVLRCGIHRVELNNQKLRQPSPPGKGVFLNEDGSNLPWVVSRLEQGAPTQFEDWKAHLKTALPDLEGIRVVERAEDKHRYLMLRYQNGLEVPSWMLSDGTLRLLALTIIPYVPGFKPICLVEEPENSMHPLNIETVTQSMRSVYGGQVLIATHSPTLLAVIEPAEILVFSRDEQRGTQITGGDKHPGLLNWRGEVSLGMLFAGGVLG
ncbi:MAG: AAA family ATPase [Phycisphaerae bacterium]|nr:AAA family ATPase [Phycisphaerae bacterium]